MKNNNSIFTKHILSIIPSLLKSVKLFFALAVILTAFSQTIYSQANGDFRSKATGNWSLTSTWETYNGSAWVAAGSVPTSTLAKTITIRNTHNVTHNVDNYTTGSSNVVVIENGGTLTISNSTAYRTQFSLLTISAGGILDQIASGGVKVSGSTTIAGTFIRTNSTGSSFDGGCTVSSGGTYRHNADGGSIPTITWNAGSTLEITGMAGATSLAFASATYQNITWDNPGQYADCSFGSSLTTVNGNLTIKSTGSTPKLLLLTNSATVTTTISGNLDIQGGYFSILGASATANSILNVLGDFSISGGTFDFIRASGYTGTLNLSGNCSITGGIISKTNGTANMVFNKSGTQTYSKTSGTISANAINFTVNSGAILNLGTSVIDGSTGAFTLSSGAGIITANENGITSSGANGSIQTTTRSFSTGANYTFNGSLSQSTGTGMPSTVNNLTINNTNGVTLTNNTTTNGVLTLTSGILTTTGKVLTIANTLTSGISGGSTTAFVLGPITWNLPSNLVAGSTYVFPLGKGTTYLPMSVVDPTTTTGTPTITGEAFLGNSGGSIDATLIFKSTSEYWSLISTGNFTNSKISLSRPTPVSPYDKIGRSTTLTGTYTSIGGTENGNSINITSTTGGGASQYFVLGQKDPINVYGSNGADGNYTSLTNVLGAFAAINSFSQTGKTIVITIAGNSNSEASTNSLNAGTWTSLTIYPTVTGLTISGNVAKPIIDLNGADNVIIDGRLNATGTVKDLTITNTSTSATAGTSTIRFINSASNNTIKYCNIKGAETNASSGIIFISTSASGVGNDNIIINNNDISSDAAGRVNNAIYSAGSSGRNNSGNTISNNHIYDVWRSTSASTINSYSVQLAGFNTDWVISENSFYETSTFAPTQDGNSYNAIRIVNTSGNNFSIFGNYIGGKDSLCGGTAMAFSGNKTHSFQAIYMSVGTTTASSIQNNTIQNINYTSNNLNPWQGINVNAGSVDVGTTTGNIIGSNSGTGSIYITGNQKITNVYGVNISSTGIVNCQNNIIGSITVDNAVGNGTNFYAINRNSASGTSTINSNLIGSSSTANSINSNSISTGDAQAIYGIYNSGGGTITIDNNIIINLTNSTTNGTTGTRGLINGISSTTGTVTITKNIIQNLTIANANTSNTNTAAVSGIALTGAAFVKTVTGNIISNLSNTSATFAGSVVGIYYSGFTGANDVSENFIHSLSVNSSSTTAKIYGIQIAAGATTYSNNIINLGGNTATTIFGIYELGASTYNNNIYFNTIYISGSLGSGITNKSYCLYSAASTNTRNFRNNVLMNERSTTGGASLHYAIYFNYTGNAFLTLNYNDYFVSGTGGVLGFYNGANKTILPLIASMDANSLAINPLFASAGGDVALDYYTAANLPGVTGTGITTDYAGITRSVTPKMGALELNDYVWQGNTSTDFATPTNWVSGAVPPNGSDISFVTTPANHCYLDQNRSLKNITNAQSLKYLVTNGKQLTITGNLNFTNNAKVDATSVSSVIIYAGTATQNIPNGVFLSNTVDGFTLNNSNGLTLSGNITIAQSLTLTDGAFPIDNNTLTLNGAIDITSGTLTGGSTSNLVFGGSSASTNLPAITLNNLTLNRANGINLSGSVSVGGTLALTSGTLTVGANILTISGNSPTRTSGNINASNSSANVIFANTTAITLPASVFTGNINNFTINGVGGVTAGSDLTIDGVLNLAVANPSSTKGLLEMTISYVSYPGTTNSSYLNSYILNMGSTASTIGVGDVTGTIKRSTILENTSYTFGHELTTIALSTGTMPDAISVSVTIGTTPAGNPDAIKRTYEIVPTVPGGYTSTAHVTANFHYLDAELTSSISPYHVNTEANLVTMDYDIGGGWGTPDEHGRSSYDFTNNFVGMSNIPISYFINIPGHAWRTIFQLRDYIVDYYTWNGSIDTDWGRSVNWTPVGVPSDPSHVIIPDAATTPNDPILPSGITINSLTFLNGGILVMSDKTLTIKNTLSGGWEDQNPLGNDPGTSKVVFSMPGTTISGNASFYDVEIGNGADVSNQAGSTMKIANTIVRTGTGKWYADVFGATVEYNGGDQTVLLTDALPHYHNLILSGSGTKTLPSSPLTLHGNLTITGTAIATFVDVLNLKGNLTINNGSTFIAEAFNYNIEGNIINNGTFTSTVGSTILMTSPTSVQTIEGTASLTSFYNLIVNNTSGTGSVTIASPAEVTNVLTLTSGKLIVGGTTFGINGTISQTLGLIEVSPISSLSFGGSTAITLNNNLFSNAPSLDSLIVNRLGGVMLGNQNMTVNGLLKLSSGILNIGANTLTIAGISPVRTSGTIDASNASATLAFANTDAITLPASFFTGVVNNLTMNGLGGITLSEDVTINNNLLFEVGLIHTGSNNLILSNVANAVTGASSDKYIDGNCRKIGNTAFTFPIGKNNLYAPIGISAADGVGSATDYFTASYVSSMPNTDGLDSTKHDTTIVRISGMEYWLLNRVGTNNVEITLSWDVRSGAVTNLSDLTIAHWNGTKWEDKGSTSTGGTNTAGTITSSLISSFSPFTLASKNRSTNLLPVLFLSFDGKCENDQNILNWATASETNNNYFEIQKSTDAKNWNIVSKIMGTGNSTQKVDYEYSENINEKYDLFYRLKQVDFDGKFEFSSVIFVKNCNNSYSEFTVFPNPVIAVVNLQFNGDKNQIRSIEIFNLLGEKVYFSDRFQSTIDLSDKQNGTYFIHIKSSTQSFVEKIVLHK